MIVNIQEQYNQVLEIADRGWENEAHFREFCERFCHMTMKVAGQLEGDNDVMLDVNNQSLPEEIKVPLTKARDLAKWIHNIISCVLNDELWFDYNNPRHLQVYRLGIREEVQKMNI